MNRIWDNQINRKSLINLVGVERFELPTSCSQSKRATGLRYTPNLKLYHFVRGLNQVRLSHIDFSDKRFG